MDWEALLLSVKLSALTVLFLLPVGVITGRWLAYSQFYGRSMVQAFLAIPLVLPPTVLGYYLLVSLGGGSALGKILERLFGHTLVFNFEGLVIASIIFNLPFAIQPIQRAFEAIPREIREAAACCGMKPTKVLWRIELPLAWTGIVSAITMTFAHTLGEFGVVLMVGGNIPGETKTIAIAIYDRVQAFDNNSAAVMSAFLLAFSMMAIAFTYLITDRNKNTYG
ncbi:MAG: molybdate ABC transporter permease subunit [Methylococcales bacterium]|nr:molybdate ABC transporter permease subunit [Methylococcales bacterium]